VYILSCERYEPERLELGTQRGGSCVSETVVGQKDSQKENKANCRIIAREVGVQLLENLDGRMRSKRTSLDEKL
jgi:hypothetical protein